MHRLVINIFKREMQRPSADHEWQIPHDSAAPIPLAVFLRELPDDEQDASYLAASVSIFNFSDIASPNIQSPPPHQNITALPIYQTFVRYL
jgi:hypothetical protein